MVHSLLPPSPSGLQLASLHSSRPRYGFIEISSLALRHRASKIRAAQSASDGASEPIKGDANSNAGFVPSASPGFSLASIPGWAAGLFGFLFFTAIPLYRRIRKVEDQVEKTVENIAEAVEKVAEVTQKVSSELGESLPAGELKNIALKVEKVAEELDKDMEKIEVLVEEVDKMEEKVDKIIDSVLEGKVTVKDNQAKKVATDSSTDSKKAS